MRAEVRQLSDEALLARVAEIRAEVDKGALYADLDVRARLIMHEAMERKLDKGLRRV